MAQERNGYGVMSDEALLEAYFNGDGLAFAEFFHRHAGKVAGYARKKGICGENTDDLVQNVFTKLHQNIDYYSPNKPALPWFFTLVHHACIDWLRSNSKNKSLLEWDEKADSQHHSWPSAQRDQDELETFSQAVAGLPNEQKRVIEMRAVQGHSFKEISGKTGRTESALRKHYERTVRVLRTLLGGKNDG